MPLSSPHPFENILFAISRVMTSSAPPLEYTEILYWDQAIKLVTQLIAPLFLFYGKYIIEVHNCFDAYTSILYQTENTYITLQLFET